MNYNEITYMYFHAMLTITVHVCMDSTRYTSMYNNNTGMYHEPRHELDYTGNTVIV